MDYFKVEKAFNGIYGAKHNVGEVVSERDLGSESHITSVLLNSGFIKRCMSKNLTQEQMQEILETLGGDLPTPYYFDFDYAVNSGYLSKELAKKIEDYLIQRKLAEEPPYDWYSQESIDDVFAILFCKFMSELTSFWNRNKNFNGTPLELMFKEFQDVLISQSDSFEVDCKVSCIVSGVYLYATPVNEMSVLQEMQSLLEDDTLSKQDIAWLALVHYEIKNANNYMDLEEYKIIQALFKKFKLEEKYNKSLEESNEQSIR